MQAAAFRAGTSRAVSSCSSSRCRQTAAAVLQQRPLQRRVNVHATFSNDDSGEGASPVAAQALQELFEMEARGVDASALETFRLKYGMRRDVNGRAQLRRSDGTWMQCKLDMEVAGTMLLRDTNDGSVHVLQTDKLEQIDLSDDYLLLTLFADGEWQGQTQPIQLGDGDKLEPLQVEEQQFKDFVGMIKTLQDMEEEVMQQQQQQPSGAPIIDVKAEPANGR
uniref:Uncharacterized protein n=1 Tax=Tetradesmus obliquus TaxID=3088 RepID=A0A383VBG5_TETOB|eukprot:jgi/Sobl393_1/3363/SZX61954.1